MSQIHHDVAFTADPGRVYRALTNAAEFAKFTGAPAEISQEPGGSFSTFGGLIVGRQVELVPDTRIVQAWRVANWPEGVYSIIRFELRAEGSGTALCFDQDGVPDDAAPHVDPGWRNKYWEPLQAYLDS